MHSECLELQNLSDLLPKDPGNEAQRKESSFAIFSYDLSLNCFNNFMYRCTLINI